MLIIAKAIVGFPDNILFTHERLVVSENKLIAIIGRNGTGKTTFLNDIVSELENQHIVVTSKKDFAYVKQISENVDPLSGGEKVKHALVKAFESKPKLLILDEPSANLDEEQCEWLKEKLKYFNGIIILVSHDIDLLNLADEIWLINKRKLKIYPGNYEAYCNKKKQEDESQKRAYKNQQNTIKRLEGEIVIRKQKAYRLKKGNGRKLTNSEKKASGKTSHDSMEKRMQAGAKAIKKRIERIKRIEKVTSEKPIKFVEPEKNLYLRKTVLKMVAQDIQINNRLLVKDASIKLKYGDKLWLRGNNGSGKTTLIKTILRNPNFIKNNINVGYFNQELQQIDFTKNIWDNVTLDSRQDNQVIYAVLGGLGLKEIKRATNELSGGQLVRLQLAKVLLGNNQLLILDEPTNYLDLATKISLQKFIKNYPGAVLIISHDRHFAQAVTDQELIIANKTLKRPQQLVKHASSFTGELLKLKLQLDKLMEDPNTSIADIKKLRDKIEAFSK